MLFLDLYGGKQLLGYGRQKQVTPGQGVAHRELREDDTFLGIRAAVEEDATVADVARVPVAPSAAREVVEGEGGSAGESAGGRSVEVGRLGWLEPSQCGIEEAEEERRRKVGLAMRRRKEMQAVEARARSAGEATRRKISSRTSSVRAAVCGDGAISCEVAAIRRGRSRRLALGSLGHSGWVLVGRNEWVTAYDFY